MEVWLEEYQALLGLLALLSVCMFVGTLVALPMLIAWIPADYFIRRPVRDWPARHLAVHLLLVFGKNLLGMVLLAAGIAMLVLPGQGLLTILVGVMLLDVPGKRRLERWLISQKPIRRAANWIRAKRHQPPLEFREEDK